MTPTAEPVLVYTTWPDAETADNAARELVTRRLAACANRLGEITSTYEWQGRIEHGTEVAMLIKSTATRFEALSAAIAELHPYDVPAILALPVSAAHPPFAAWIAAQTAPQSPEGEHHG
jgi:periplasmic divalent cation tolerance protein